MVETIMNSSYLSACRHENNESIPIWLMRQAGRYMESYRNLRNQFDFLTLVKTPELASEITLQPVKEFCPDAAIIFSDILIVLEAIGLKISFAEHDGPLIENLVSSENDISRLRMVDAEEDLAYTLKAIGLVKKELAKSNTPLIGFCGAPFTLAYYAIDGGKKNSVKSISLFYQRPDLWDQIQKKLNQAILSFLTAQVRHGADALQIFDSWAGMLAPHEYEAYVLPYVKKLLGNLKELSVPVTYFSTQTTGYLDLLHDLPCQVLSLDWRIDMAKAWAKKNPLHAWQGNLSPHILLSEPLTIREQVKKMLDSLQMASGNLSGYIFNLGHGIHKDTPIKNVHALFDEVKSYQLSV
jgi:uroporphyrinogen decarboxylase